MSFAAASRPSCRPRGPGRRRVVSLALLVLAWTRGAGAAGGARVAHVDADAASATPPMSRMSTRTRPLSATEAARPAMRLFTDRDGLPQNTGMGLARDAQGFLWIGTQDGLARWDGRRFTVLDLPRHELSNFLRVVRVLEDGSVLCGRQDGGLARLRGDSFTSYDASSGLPSSRVNALAETRDGSGRTLVWVGTDQGLALLDGERVRVVATSALPSSAVQALVGETEPGSEGPSVIVGTRRGLARAWANGRVEALEGPVARADERGLDVAALLQTRDTDGRETLWVGTHARGLFRRTGGRWLHVDRTRGLPHDDVLALAETTTASGAREVWAGTDGGLVKLSGGHWIPVLGRDDLPSPSIYALLPIEGPAGTRELWVGLDGGVARLSFTGIGTFDRARGLPGSSVFSVLAGHDDDGDDALWVGTRGAGLARFAKGTWTSMGRDDGLPDDTVFALHELVENGRRTLLVGTQGGGLAARDEGGRFRVVLPRAGVRHFHEVRREGGTTELWAATGGDGLFVHTGGAWRRESAPAGIPLDASFCTTTTRGDDGEPVLWVGTQGAGVARRRNGEWRLFSSATGDLASDSVLTLHVERAPGLGDVLWAGTEGGGLSYAVLSAPEPRFTTLTASTTPALPNDTVYQLRADALGRVHGFTNRGGFRVERAGDGTDAHRLAITTLTMEDGLAGNEFNGGASTVDGRGRIWVGGVAGLTVLDPRLEVAEPEPRAIVLAPPRLASGRLLSPGDSLAHDEASLAFSWVLPSLFRGDATRYATELVGLDRRPTPFGPNDHREVTTLGAGDYALRVWAEDHRGRVVGPRSIAFSVRAAPWNTGAAWALYALFAMASGYVVFRARTRALSRRNEELEVRIAERTAELADKVTLLAVSEQKARAAEAQAREASRAKSAFLSTMSHELRTPLSAILGFSQLLSRDKDARKEQREGVEIIARSGEHLLGLINDVLSISRIEAGKITLAVDRFDPHDTLAAAIAITRGRAAQKRLALSASVSEALPHAAFGDEAKLRQILVNLVGNAVKFTDAGRITVRASYAHGAATFAVEDTGRGIAPEEQGGLFETFTQTESGRSAKDGTGLGLSISRAFARKMGGDVTVTSERGVGSTFTLVVPLPPAGDTAAASAPVAEVIGLAPGERPRRILVADDGADNRALLRALLVPLGFEVHEAASGPEAVRAHARLAPDLTFMDLRMGDTDGIAATRAIRDTEVARGARSKIVALSASAFEEDRAALLEAGCDAFLPKPFRHQAILESLARELGVRYQHADDVTPDGLSLVEVTPARLAALPEELRAALLRAVTSGDLRASRDAARDVAAQDRALGNALATMIDAFRLEELQERLESGS